MHSCDSMGTAGIWVVLSKAIRGTSVSVDDTLLLVGATALSGSMKKAIGNLRHCSVFLVYLITVIPAFRQNTYIH